MPSEYVKQRVNRPADMEGLVSALSSTQDAIADVLRPFCKNPILEDGALLEGVELGVAAVDVPHKLGRKFRGWSTTRIRGPAAVYEDTTQPDPLRFVRLVATATVTVDLYVFA
mgnify:CR=1 FL=1